MKGNELKILFIISSLKIGGAQNLLLNICRIISDKYNIKVKVIALRGGEISEEFTRAGIDTVIFNYNCLVSAGVFSDIYRIIKDFSPDIVHTHLQKADFYGRICARLAGVNIIITTCHSTSIVHKKTFYPVEKLYELIDNFVARYSRSVVVAISESVRKWLIKRNRYFSNVTYVINNGIDINQFNGELSPETAAKLRNNLGLKNQGKVLAFIGRLEYQKGVDILLKELEPELCNNVNLTLLLVGDGNMLNDLKKKYTKLLNQGKIIFTGFRQDIPDIIKLSDIIIVPSRREGLGNIILEAMASRKIVLCSDVDAIPEIINDGVNGFLFNINTPDSLVSRLKYIINNFERLSNVRNSAYNYVNEKFNINITADRYYNYYLKLLNKFNNAE